jgi:hypothetical protein
MVNTDPDGSSVPVAMATTSAGVTTITSWASPSTPMPSTLPARRWCGRMVESSTSTTRVVFSSTTPVVTATPKVSSAR